MRKPKYKQHHSCETSTNGGSRMKLFGTGFIPDPQDVRNKIPATNILFGASRTGVPQASSLAHFIKIRDQKLTESCVGFAWAYAIRARFGFMNINIDPAPLHIYTLARMMGAEPEQRLVDTGSTPHCAVEGLQTYGIVQEHHYPFNASDIDINDDVPWDILNRSSAYLMRGIYKVASQGEDRIFELKQSIARGYPIFFGTFMSERINQYSNLPLIPDGNETGGHALCIVGYDGDIFTIANSYGTSYGDNGFLRVHKSFLTHPLSSHFYVASVDVR